MAGVGSMPSAKLAKYIHSARFTLIISFVLTHLACRNGIGQSSLSAEIDRLTVHIDGGAVARSSLSSYIICWD